MTRPPRRAAAWPAAALVLVLVLGFGLVATACGGTATPPAEPTSAAPTPDPVAERYVRYCAACHGADGRTVAGMPAVPLLRGQGLLSVADDAFLFASIADGRPGDNGRGKPGTKMPAFHASRRGALDDAQIDELVAYIRAWQTEPSIPLDAAWRADGDPERGRARFAADCASCHGEDGWGANAPRLAGETLQAGASDDFLRQTILRGRPGTTMPAHAYDADTVADVVTFIRTLGPDGDAGGDLGDGAVSERDAARRARPRAGVAVRALAAIGAPRLAAGAAALAGGAIDPDAVPSRAAAEARRAWPAQDSLPAETWVPVDTWRAAERPPLGGVLDPVDLDIAADGSVYVLDRGLHRAQRFDDRVATKAYGGGIGLAAGDLDGPLGVAADVARGRLLVSDTGRGAVARFDLATGELTRWPDLGGPESIAVATDGRAYVYERERNGISGRGADGAQELLFPVQRALSFVAELPRGLAVSPRGTVFFAAENPVANNPNVLYEFDAAGETLRPRTALPWQIFDIAFADDDRMWLLDGTNARLVGDLDRDRATSGPGVAVPGGAHALAAGEGGRLSLLYGPTSERPAGIVELVADGAAARQMDAWSFPPLDPAWLPAPQRLSIAPGTGGRPVVVDGTERAVLANVHHRRVDDAFARPGLQEALRLPGGGWVVARTRFAATYDPRDDPDVAAPGTRRVRIERYPAAEATGSAGGPAPLWTWEHVEPIDSVPITLLTRLVHDPVTGRVHALDAGSGAVITLDEGGALVRRLALPSRPGIPAWSDLVLLPDGALAALHGGARELHRLDEPEPGAPPIALDVAATPLRIGVDANRNLHVLCADRTVAVLALDGARRSIAALPPPRTVEPDAPSDLAVAPIGTVYVADPSDRSVHVLVPSDLGLRPAFLPALAR